MAEDSTGQEEQYTRPVDEAEARSWLHENGSTAFPGLESYSDEQVSTIVFSAIRDGAPKNMALDDWALQRFARIYQTNETQFDAQVMQPAYEVGVLIGSLFRAVQRVVTRNLSQRELAKPQSAEELLAKQLPPLRYFVQEILTEGLTILGGKPKKGKSCLALDMSLALAIGRQAFQKFDTEQARVLYVSLEDGERRLQTRLRKIQPNLKTPKGLDFLYEFPHLGGGALEALQGYAKSYNVIILDVLGRMLPQQQTIRKNLSEYQEFTEHLGPIQKFAQEEHIAILIIDHVRKAGADDIFDTIIGSQGKWGTADNGMVYERKGEEKDAVLHIAGRDLDEQKIVLTMMDGHLEFLGKGESFEVDSEQNKIIKVLEEEGRPMSIPEIMKAVGIGEQHYKRFRVVMHRLYNNDRVGRTKKRGLYTLYGHDRQSDWDDKDLETVPF
jgi:hypothetical protein